MQPNEKKLSVPNQIPRFYMYDIARGAYLRPDSLCELLRHAAKCHYTHFIPYLENMIDLPSMTKGAEHCAYTRQDWETFQKTAEEAGIEVVPHFNVIGHSNKICIAYPELTGISPDDEKKDHKNIPDDPFYFAELDPTSPVTQQWMLRCLKEFCDFSKSEYFLLGGDEWNIQPHLLKQEGMDAGRVWCDYMNMAVEYLASRNRTAIIWHDMLVHYPHVLERLSKKAVIAFWFYDFDSGYPFLDTLKKYGFRTIMATGLCAGSLSMRREKGFHCAMRECVKYQADGFMVTTWSDGRWERQYANIELCGKLLDEGQIPSIYPETLSRSISLTKIKGDVDAKTEEDFRALLKKNLADPAWNLYPGYRDLLKGTESEDVDFLSKMYEQHHYPEGPLYERITKGSSKISYRVKHSVPVRDNGFGVELTHDAVTGNTICFRNGTESFVLYPDYGGRMQNWHIDGTTLTPNSLPSFLKKNPNQLPGSFKSYSSAGFSPMWNIGTHLNPNITWNYPWKFRIDTSDPDEPAVEMFQTFSHVEIRYRVSIKKGVHGFRWHARAVNKMPHIHAAFGWNFLLSDHDILKTTFRPDSEKEELCLLDFCTDLPVLDCSTMILKNPEWKWALILETDPEQSGGFGIDWGVDWMTPDLHGKYRALEVGDVYETQWNFRLEPLK